MGRKTKRFINKNDKSSFTFNLIHPDNRDPRLRSDPSNVAQDEDVSENEAERVVKQSTSQPSCSVLQRVTPKNALKKGKVHVELPANLCNALQPEDFGIHGNLPPTELVNLCDRVYGSFEQYPEALKKKIATHHTSCTTAPRQISHELLDTADCYFPLDGYDYEKHLRVMRPECVRPAATKTPLSDTRKNLTPEEEEVLRALENVEEYEELSDGILHEVVHGADEDLLLWGHVNPKDGTVFRSPEEKEEIQRLLNMTRETDQLDKESPCEDNDTLQRMLEEEYNEEDIGELDEDLVISKNVNVEALEPLLHQFQKETQRKKVSIIVPGSCHTIQEEPNVEKKHVSKYEIEPLDETQYNKVLELLQHLKPVDEMSSSSSDESNEVTNTFWDCETILSTHTNVDNRPGRIHKPSFGKSSLPGILEKLIKTQSIRRILETTQTQLRCSDQDSVSTTPEDTDSEHHSSTSNPSHLRLEPISTKRSPNETKEEKRARKKAVKTARRMIRQSKKEIAAMHKNDEKKRKELQTRCQDMHRCVRHLRL